MPIRNITRNVERYGEAGQDRPNDEETCEANFIQVLRIKEEIGYAQILSKVSSDHCDQQDPTQ
ncbi:MAG: hypothetical protein RH860_08550 [Cytophagales bacterium]